MTTSKPDMELYDNFIGELDKVLVDNDIKVNTAIRVDRLFEAGVAPAFQYSEDDLAWNNPDAWLEYELLMCKMVETPDNPIPDSPSSTRTRRQQLVKENTSIIRGDIRHSCDIEGCEIERLHFPVLRTEFIGDAFIRYRHLTQWARYRNNTIYGLPEEWEGYDVDTPEEN